MSEHSSTTPWYEFMLNQSHIVAEKCEQQIDGMKYRPMNLKDGQKNPHRPIHAKQKIVISRFQEWQRYS